ncbi:CoA transferase subunit A [Syntrophomonas palmitatica]|uniref:CoA transferase subunit A n=1 Tax=Syntrophomonas palmitatica TaxID=402877 RepID=UPI0006CFDAE1|nr:CoA-transferase [Syntrophomonas palmitatica]
MGYQYITDEQFKRLVDFQGAREFHLHKDRAKRDKRMSLTEAVGQFVQDGDIFAETGFSYVRAPLQAYFEMIRQGKKNLVSIGSPMSNTSYLMALGLVKAIHLSYIGVEMRGNDKNFARVIKTGQAEIVSIWSHGAMALGFKAAQLGAPFIASKQLLGSDMLKQNPYVKVIDSPVGANSEPVCLIPALFPDVCIVHVQKADRYGNAVIEGPAVNDIALAAASRKVIITAERIVPEMTIRDASDAAIPFWYVDAVVDMPYGALPGCCPGHYYWAREWWEWLVRICTPTAEGTKGFFEYWVNDTKDQYDFIEKLGGIRFMDEARRLMEAAQATIDDSLVSFAYQEVIPKRD